jgi:hypothetical protein
MSLSLALMLVLNSPALAQQGPQLPQKQNQRRGPAQVVAPPEAPAFPAVQKSQKGTIQSEEAEIYQDSNFDAPVIGMVKGGAVYDISVGKKNGFYKIRLKPGSLGWIADSDILGGISADEIGSAKPTKPGIKTKKNKPVKKGPKPIVIPKKKSGPFSLEDYRGPALEFLPFQETTLGDKRKDNLIFYGYKFSGPNLLIDGDTVTDATILFHYGAPKYYKDTTGNDASGFIILANFLFESNQIQGPDTMTFYGFGPAFRYSQFNVGLTTSGQNLNYTATDMTVGAVFNGGLAYRANNYAARLEAKYYWEKETYLGFGISFLWKF